MGHNEDSELAGGALVLGVLAVGRSTFDLDVATQRCAAVVDLLEREGHRVVGSAEPCTDAGAVDAAVELLAGADVDAVVLLHGTFTDATPAIALAAVADPVVLWSFPEARSGGRLALNSFCGANLAAFSLVRRGMDVRFVHRDPADPQAARDLRRSLTEHLPPPGWRAPKAVPSPEAERVAAEVAEALVGRVGDPPIGFEPCLSDPHEVRAITGATEVDVGLDEWFDRARAVEMTTVAAARRSAARRLGDLGHLDEAGVDAALRLEAGLASLADEETWSALAPRCWPECMADYGGAICAGAAHLAEQGRPVACEADVWGAVTALVASRWIDAPVFLADLVDLDMDGDTGVVWHCGVAPVTMARPGSARASVHPNRGLPLTYDFGLAPGPVTLVRLSQARARIGMVVGEAEILDTPQPFLGTSGVVRFVRPAARIAVAVMGGGLEHHLVVMPGHHARDLEQLAAVWDLPVLSFGTAN